MNITVKAYYERQKDSIDGLFTIQSFNPATGKISKLFNRLPARSGQNGYANTDWTQGKSPIPRGKYRLWLQVIKNAGGELAAGSGIGWAFHISSGDNPGIIMGPDGHERQDCMLHTENAYPGTEGCIALLHYTAPQSATVESLIAYLMRAGRSQPWIELDVI